LDDTGNFGQATDQGRHRSQWQLDWLKWQEACRSTDVSVSDIDGQIAYDLGEFCKDYGHPDGQLFTFEVTCDAVTYVYADVVGTVRGGKVIFELGGDDLVCTRKAH
jgi:hypothetical protein